MAKKTANKTATKKAATKKTATKKTAVRKTPAKKPAAKKTPAKKPAAKKTPAKKPAAKKKPATKRSPAIKRNVPVAIEPPRAVEARADDAVIERTLELLDGHDQRTAGSMREIGEHLLVTYFGGDPELAQSSSPLRPYSYAKLAQRAELDTSWDAADLRRAVNSAIVYRGLPSTIADVLPPSYLWRLSSVDDPSARVALAARIVAGELRGEAAKLAITAAGAGDRRGGAKPVPGPIRFAAAIDRLLERAGDFGGFDVASVGDRNALERAELAGRFDDAARKLAAIAARLRA